MPDGIGFPNKDRCYRIVNFAKWEGRVLNVVCWLYETASKGELRFTFSEDFSEVTAELRGRGHNDPFKLIGKGKR
jgi:hypothetical protein